MHTQDFNDTEEARLDARRFVFIQVIYSHLYYLLYLLL